MTSTEPVVVSSSHCFTENPYFFLLLIGDSTETSPSWASASSSAMETPNDVDQPLAFDFSRKCELTSSSPGNPSDLRRQLVLPRARVVCRCYSTKSPLIVDQHFFLSLPSSLMKGDHYLVPYYRTMNKLSKCAPLTRQLFMVFRHHIVCQQLRKCRNRRLLHVK